MPGKVRRENLALPSTVEPGQKVDSVRALKLSWIQTQTLRALIARLHLNGLDQAWCTEDQIVLWPGFSK
jgi:hypothetical protein